MASTFRNLLRSEIGTDYSSPVLTTGSAVKTTVIGLSLTNMTAGIILASILIDDGVDSAYYLKDVVVPPNQSLRVINGGEKLILGSNVDVFIYANTNNAMDLVMSFVEISG